MNRRELFMLSVIVWAGLALDGLALAFGLSEKSEKPNILFIMTDQQHAEMMSCAGNEWLKTPAMDSLAQEGIRFENAYCANPVCAPSRTSMATGVMSCRLGGGSNREALNIKALPSEVDDNSMGKLMKRAGYDTFYGGKVHLCESLDATNAGYDQFHKDQRDTLPDACLRFIKKERSRPFFAVASFINPHDIFYAHKATLGKGRTNLVAIYEKASSLPLKELPPLPENSGLPKNEPSGIAKATSMLMRNTYDEKAWRIYRWMYCRLTEEVDEHIGRILDGLKEAGLEDSTLVIFTSDHGDMDASHKLPSVP